jgi:hypothetical protein
VDEPPEEGSSDPAVPADALLAAYRAGRLPEEETRRLEALLGRSVAARARLAQLAGVAPAPPATDTRRRTLEALGRPPRRRSSGRLAAWSAAWSPAWRWAAAAVLAVGVGALLTWSPGAPRPRPATPLPELHASIHGRAEVRSAPADNTGRGAVASPDTRVVITAVLDPPRAGLEVALYALHGDGETFERLPAVPRWESRSEATFHAAAAQLVGPEPGVHVLFVVAGGEGSLPARAAARPGAETPAAEALAAALGGGLEARVEPLTLEIAPEPPFGSPPEPSSEPAVPGPSREEASRP